MLKKPSGRSSFITKLTIFASAYGIGSAGENIKKDFETSMQTVDRDIINSRIALERGEKVIAEARRAIKA